MIATSTPLIDLTKSVKPSTSLEMIPLSSIIFFEMMNEATLPSKSNLKLSITFASKEI